MGKKTPYQRLENRSLENLRPLSISTGVSKQAEGSALIEVGDTRVLCTASIEEKVPSFLTRTQDGWVTAEYGMLPRATSTRTSREASRGKVSGRTMEIQRLIGRSLRAVVDGNQLGPRTVWLDCDVLQADGGTRTASITGAFVALAQAMAHLLNAGILKDSPLTDLVAATSVGIVSGEILLDLNYREDSAADVDMNVVMTGGGKYVEVQGTGENQTFTQDELIRMLRMAREGIQIINEIQLTAIEESAGLSIVLPKYS